MMLDLNAIEARAEAATPDLEILPILAIAIKDAAIQLAATAADVPALVAELRAAREVVEAKAAYLGDEDFPGEHFVHEDDMAVALVAYRAVVGEQP